LLTDLQRPTGNVNSLLRLLTLRLGTRILAHGRWRVKP
jgi:hypothetical protein